MFDCFLKVLELADRKRESLLLNRRILPNMNIRFYQIQSLVQVPFQTRDFTFNADPLILESLSTYTFLDVLHFPIEIG